jgi:hypothetical protein
LTSQDRQQQLREIAERAERRRAEAERLRSAERQARLERNREVRRAALAQGQ